jgi:hypothetical protein
MSVTINGSTTAMRLAASSFTGVSPTWPLDVVKSNNGNGGNPSVSVTPTMATDAVVATLSKYGGTASGGGGSTPAYVQSTKAVNAFNVTFPSAVPTGDLVVVSLTVFNQTIASNDITDNKGNTHTKVAESIKGTDHAAIFYAQNVSGGSSFQVNSSVHGTLAIHEYSGVATTGAFDKKSTASGTSNKPATGAATTTTANELYFGVAWSAGNLDTRTAGNGYTFRQNETDNNNNERLATEDQVIASASTSVAWYTTSTSADWAGAMATFLPASGGGGGTSADATSSQTTLFKSVATSTFGGASYTIATTSGTITDTYTTNASSDWVMAAADHLDGPPRTRPVRPDKRTRSEPDGWSRAWARALNRGAIAASCHVWPRTSPNALKISALVTAIRRVPCTAPRKTSRPRGGSGFGRSDCGTSSCGATKSISDRPATK